MPSLAGAPPAAALHGDVVGVAIFSTHINLYSTVNIIIFGQTMTTEKDVCDCMHLYELF